jgi:hypothetical protein
MRAVANIVGFCTSRDFMVGAGVRRAGIRPGEPAPARQRARRGKIAASFLMGACLTALPLRAQEQGPCQGSLSASSSSAPALAKFTPAAERSGVVFHGWLDVNRAPASAHLVIENTNPYSVAVRFEAELRGDAGPASTGSRCVWIRAREFALDRPGLTVFQYRGTTLSQIRISAAEITPLDRPPPAAGAAPPPAPARPRPRPARVNTPRAAPARAPVRDTVRRRAEREAAPETLQASVPIKRVQADTLPAAQRRVARAPVARPPAARPVTRPAPRKPKPPPMARAANRTMRVAAGMVLIPAGVVLGIAVAAAVTLLGGIVPLGVLRRGAVEKNVTRTDPKAPT